MSESISVRPAGRADVRAIVAMLADDALGATRERFEDPLPQSYYVAFEAIDADPNHELVVAEMDGLVVGTLQLSVLPYLTYQGRSRAQVEAVRINSNRRGAGIGALLMDWAIDRARRRGCHLIQLTTDKARPEALRFYEQRGFRASHQGMKLWF